MLNQGLKIKKKKKHVLFHLKYQKEEGIPKDKAQAECSMLQQKRAGKNKTARTMPVTQPGTEAKH